MGEVINVIVAFAVIVLIFRWVASGSDTPKQSSPADILGFQPKNVTQQMVDQISTMFPDIPADNIRFDLLRTGSVEQTINKILLGGYLEVPPAAYFTLYPRSSSTAASATAPSSSTAASPSPKKPKETLITRFKLEAQVKRVDTLYHHEDDHEDDAAALGGKAVWMDTPEAREASLRERKAKMVLAARRRLLAQQERAAAASSGGS